MYMKVEDLEIDFFKMIHFLQKSSHILSLKTAANSETTYP